MDTWLFKGTHQCWLLSNSINCLIIKCIEFIEFIEFIKVIGVIGVIEFIKVIGVIGVIEVIKVAIKIWATKVWATKVGVNYISSFLQLIVVVKVKNRGNSSKTCLSYRVATIWPFFSFPRYSAWNQWKLLSEAVIYQN